MVSDAADDDLTDGLHQLVARYARSIGIPIALGPYGTLRFNFFNDLLSASHVDEHLLIMTQALVKTIRDSDLASTATIIACPKRGNTLLGRSAAKALELQSLFVRDDVLASRHVEGSYGKREKVILVDDVSSDGDLLLDAVDGLRREGLNVECAFTVINRREGNAVRKLRDEGIALHSCLTLDDEEVRSLIHAHKVAPIVT